MSQAKKNHQWAKCNYFALETAVQELRVSQLKITCKDW